MTEPSVRARIASIGTDLVSAERRSSDYLFVRSESENWALPIKASGVSVD